MSIIVIVEDLRPGRTPDVGDGLNETDAVNYVRAGGDVIVIYGRLSERRSLAERIARLAGGVQAAPFSGGTAYDDRTTAAERRPGMPPPEDPRSRPRTLPHRHPVDATGQRVGGHVFFDDRGRDQSPTRGGR